MDEKEVQAKIEEAKAAAIAAKEAEIEALKTQLGSEIAEERRKKQEAEAERDLLKGTKKENEPAANDVESTVKAILSQRDQEDIKARKDAAIQRFRNSNKEFHPDNDPGGLKWAAFEQRLARLNLQGLKSEDDFASAFDDALVLMNKGKTQAQQTYTPYASSPSAAASDPKGGHENKLTSKELKAIQLAGVTEDYFLKLKKSRPSYVEALLRNVSDE